MDSRASAHFNFLIMKKSFAKNENPSVDENAVNKNYMKCYWNKKITSKLSDKLDLTGGSMDLPMGDESKMN